MWFEDMLLLAILAIGVFIIGVPIYKFVKVALPKRRNALAEAKERLEQARLDVEAARLNKEADQLYDQMIEELEDEKQQENVR